MQELIMLRIYFFSNNRTILVVNSQKYDAEYLYSISDSFR